MRIIINHHSGDIGGIETFFFDLANLLINDHEVFFLCNEKDNFYETNNIDNRIIFIYKNDITPVEFMSKKAIRNEETNILQYFDMNQEYYVISMRFPDLQYAMSIFGGFFNFKLLHFWNHPMAWISHLYMFGLSKYVTKRIVINKTKYNYQRSLLKELELKFADYQGMNIKSLEYNNWFYDLDCSLNPNSFSIPVLSKCTNQRETNNFMELKSLRVLWVGRYDWFKLEAIAYIVESLEKLSYGFLNHKISLDLAGYGSVDQEIIIEKLKANSSLSINILGKIEYSNLTKLFENYDIGVAMGLTVKNMADCNLPSILIDSMNVSNVEVKSCSWIFDINDDAGDEIYFNIAGQSSNRKSLYDLIHPILEGKEDLFELSRKSKNFFDKNYSMQKNLPKLLYLLTSSQFAGLNYKIYRRSFIIRTIYYYYHLLPKALQNKLKKLLFVIINIKKAILEL
jgi:hypothetical protein